VDYDKLGLKVGLEIHAQLDTKKLFCSCATELLDDQDFSFMRRLRPTMSELGEIDPAAKDEFKKGMENLYKTSIGHSCLVYADEEPPHDPNPEAVTILLQIASMLKADIVDKIHFMRKVVIDGSNVGGFQRTALVALNGKAFSEYGNVLIPVICLEEDAARLIETSGKTKIWNIDRLGTPLVEIATDPSMHHPRQARDIALYLGQVMKATGRLKRGIGTIRQDVNVSISGGARVEIKGVQELNLIEECVSSECARQVKLLEIQKELKRRGVATINTKVHDVSSVFEETACKIINGPVFGIRLAGFSGLLGTEVQKGRRLGTEMADYAKKYVRGIFHSDELPSYGITPEEVESVKEALAVGDGDAFVLVTGSKSICRLALKEVIRRAHFAIEGVPNETRRPLPDGNSQYMRPLPGRSRMYPETDIYPVVVPDAELKMLQENLPELPEEKIKRLCSSYGITPENARKILEWGVEDAFVASQERYNMAFGKFLRLMETLVMLSRDMKSAAVDRDFLLYSFMEAHEPLPLESYEGVLRHMAKHSTGAREAISSLGISRASDDDIRKIIRSVIKENSAMLEDRGKQAFKPLMGMAMAKLKGKCDGKTISALLKEELEKES